MRERENTQKEREEGRNREGDRRSDSEGKREVHKFSATATYSTVT